ncbi:MAG: hypothetical protein ACTHOO_08255 [Alcanivorax sp.]
MGLDEFEENAGYVQNETTLGQRIVRGAVGVTLLTAVATGLGYMQQLGDEKADAQMREKLTEEQMSTILEAARSETCEVIHPKLQRICLTEEDKLDAPEI